MLRFLSVLSISIFLIANMASAQDEVMGNWEGRYQTESYDSGKLRAQIIAEGNGTYRAIVRIGEEWEPSPGLTIMGKSEDKKTVFSGMVDVGYELGGTYRVSATIAESKFAGRFVGDEASGSIEMSRVDKKPATLGATPPAGAVVLFDGKNLNAWQRTDGKPAKWKLTEEGAMEVTNGTIITKQKFQDCKLHVEFRTPYMPEARGQARGNSGVYLQGRYEIQVLDSFGLEATEGDCGGIYGVAPPKVNACLPPTVWQTYDITFYAPKYDNAGNKLKDAEVTVDHNGQIIHDNVSLPGPTGGSLEKDAANPGGLMLQDHENPVQFRNIWLLPL